MPATAGRRPPAAGNILPRIVESLTAACLFPQIGTSLLQNDCYKLTSAQQLAGPKRVPQTLCKEQLRCTSAILVSCLPLARRPWLQLCRISLRRGPCVLTAGHPCFNRSLRDVGPRGCRRATYWCGYMTLFRPDLGKRGHKEKQIDLPNPSYFYGPATGIARSWLRRWRYRLFLHRASFQAEAILLRLLHAHVRVRLREQLRQLWARDLLPPCS